MSSCPSSHPCVHTHLCVSTRPATAPQLIPDGSLARNSPKKWEKSSKSPPTLPSQTPVASPPLAVAWSLCQQWVLRVLGVSIRVNSPPGCSWTAVVVPSRKSQLLGAGLAPPGSHNAWRSWARHGFPSPAAICSQPCLCPYFSPHSPQQHCPGALGLFLQDFSAWEEHRECLRGQKFQDWVSREEKDS